MSKSQQYKPSYIKFKKLRSHDPSDDKKKHISKFIQNDTFLGEDKIGGASEVIITEGIPDWVSAIDHGFAAISPGTTNFREKDLDKLVQLTKNAARVFIINDNEENGAGLKGAMKTGKYLAAHGRQVFIVVLPRPKNVEKIDLNEYLRDHTVDDLRRLMNEAESVMDILIKKLPNDFVKASDKLKNGIAPILLNYNESLREHYMGLLARKLKTSKSTLKKLLEETLKQQQVEKNETRKKQVDPEIEKMAERIAKDPSVFKKRIDLVNSLGVVGERKNIAMYTVVLDSRLLIGGTTPETLAIKNAGHFGSGKSYTLSSCLKVYPASAFKFLTSGSNKIFYYMDNDIKHKAIIFSEGFDFEKKNSDSQLLYSLRTLLSEGYLEYSFPSKDEDGNFRTMTIRIDGPASFITTTINEELELQFEDRIFTIHPDESVEQTKKIVMMNAKKASGDLSEPDKKVINAWKRYHEKLECVKIVIPYANKIVSHLVHSDQNLPISIRRASNRIFSIIKSIACTYQYQREKDHLGRIKAEISDYAMACQIARETFREGMGQYKKSTQERLNFIKENGPVKIKDISKHFGVSESAISSWSRKLIQEGCLYWCNKKGEPFSDEKEEKRAKSTGNGYLMLSSESHSSKNSMGLPTPYELTEDPDWGEGGRLYKKYDLKLDRGTDGIKRYQGDKAVTNDGLVTEKNNEDIEIVNEKDQNNGGDKVTNEKDDIKKCYETDGCGIEKHEEREAVELAWGNARFYDYDENEKYDDPEPDKKSLACDLPEGILRI